MIKYLIATLFTSTTSLKKRFRYQEIDVFPVPGVPVRAIIILASLLANYLGICSIPIHFENFHLNFFARLDSRDYYCVIS